MRVRKDLPAARESFSRRHFVRVSVDRVNVGVIVTDSHGAFLSRAYGRKIFTSSTTASEQPITDFASIDEPAQVLMLRVEAGPSVYFLEAGHLPAAEATAQRPLRRRSRSWPHGRLLPSTPSRLHT